MSIKKYQLISISILVSIGIPVSSFASVSYSRSPSGTSIASPVTFTVSFDNIASDLEMSASDNFWGVGVENGSGAFTYSSCVPVSTKSNSFAVTLPANSYTDVFVIGSATLANCQSSNPDDTGIYFEGDGSKARFSVAGSSAFVAVPIIQRTAAFIKDLDFGSAGDDVKILQAFLAGDPTIYLEGLVTGYFGMLTQKAVENFQIKYGIVSGGTPETTGFGRVGPKTRAKLNEILTDINRY